MGRLRWSTAAGLVVLLTASTAMAHGGYYQGPKTPDGIPLPTSTPGTGTPLPQGGPITPPTLGPAVTGRKDKSPPPAVTPPTTSLPAAIVDPPVIPTGWEAWWAFHREEHLRAAIGGGTPLDISPRRRDAGDGPDVDLTDAAVEVLLAATKDGSADVRASAVLALARSGDERASAAIRAVASGDAEGDVRDVAVLSLGVLGDPGDLPFLHGVLIDRKATVRRRSVAAVALGMIGGDDAVDLLVMSLQPGERSAAKLPPELVSAGLVGLAASRRPSALGPLREALANNRLHSQVRAHAITGLGAVGDRESLDRLVHLLLNAGEVHVRQSAAVAVGRVLSTEDVQAVNALLHVIKNDRDQGVQSLATLALGSIRGEAVRDQLLALFAKSSDNDRGWRALALGLQGDALGAAAIRSAFRLDTHEESLQCAYAIALALLGDVDCREILQPELGRHRRFWSPMYVAQALAMLGMRAASDDIHERLKGATDPRQRAALATALGLLRDQRATERLLAALERRDSVYEACTAAMALGAAGSRDALPALVKLARDADRSRYERACAVSAVGRILDPSDVPALAEVLAPQNHLLRVDALVFARDLLDRR
jgi:HEAT repeat protein